MGSEASKNRDRDGVLVGVFGGLRNVFPDKRDQNHSPCKDEILVLRTPGGMLEASTLVKNEVFAWSTKHNCPLIDCDDFLGATISEIRIPVHYTYRIPLPESWILKSRDTHYELVVPIEEPKLPVAIDFKMELKTNRGWLSPSTQGNRVSLLRQLGPELARRSIQKHYIDAQRDEAQKTIAEFAGKWMKEQGLEKRRADMPIKVVFKGDATH